MLARHLDDGLEQNVSFEDEDYINSVCSDIAEWLSAAANTDGAEKVIERGPLAFSYVLHLELRSRFLNLWTFPTENDAEVNLLNYLEWKICQFSSLCMQIVARVVSGADRSSLSSNKGDLTTLKTTLLTRLRGFSRIVDTLVAESIPIVGHNCLMDLMLIYQVQYLQMTSQCISGLNHVIVPTTHDELMI